jgi:hypothetical protein
MLKECKRDLDNVLELIEIERKRKRKRLTPKELAEHDKQWMMLIQMKYELMQKEAILTKKVKQMEGKQ